MVNVRIRYALKSSAELCHALRDEDHSWLDRAEHRELDRLRDPIRRRTWLDARWLTKLLFCQEVGIGLSRESLLRWRILSSSAAGRGRRPRLWRDGRELERSVSISHLSGQVLVAFGETAGIAIGADLVAAEPLGEGFLSMWFTEREREAVLGDNDSALRVWAAKEAVYKACNQDDGFLPRAIEILLDRQGRFSAVYRGQVLGDRCHITCWKACERFCAIAAMVPANFVSPQAVTLIPA